MMRDEIDSVCQIAKSLPLNCGFPVFPCRSDKRPTVEGGFRTASRDPAEIDALWRHRPGPLIGIPTGVISGVDVLDIDRKDDIAFKWLSAAQQRISGPTRTYRTRSDGLHLYFRHVPGVRNSQGKLARGVDVRGDGGYVIFWYAAGFECVDHGAIAPWPVWLRDLVVWKRKQPPAPPVQSSANAGRAIDGIIRTVAAAPEGRRNAVLYWGAHRLDERALAGEIARREALDLLTSAGQAVGLNAEEVARTLRSAWGGLRG